MIGAMNPKDSHVYRKLIFQQTFDSEGVAQRLERIIVYKHTIHSGLGFYHI
jgi:hypothetical protein